MADNFNNQFDPQDIQENKTISILAYLIFFLPLLAAPQSKFGRFHSNQGLLVFLIYIVSVAVGKLPLIGFIGAIFSLIALVFMILGMVNASKGLAKELPIIGNISIIK